MRRVLLVGLCLPIVAVLARAQSPAEKQATVAYVRKLQAREGGFLPAAGAKSPTLRATSSAVRALGYFGGEPADRAACAEFVKGCFDKNSGGFSDVPGGKPDVISTAIGLMAVVALKLPTENYADSAVRYLGENANGFEEIRLAAAGLEAVGRRPRQADDWLAQVAKMRDPSTRVFGKGDAIARDTASATVTLLRLGAKAQDADVVPPLLDVMQRTDGGFGKAGVDKSDLETTYRVLRCYHMLKAKPKQSDKCREFIGKCRNSDGGYGVVPGEASSVSGTYFAGSILHWLEE
jgi:prenyltransferase beta subunit